MSDTDTSETDEIAEPTDTVEEPAAVLTDDQPDADATNGLDDESGNDESGTESGGEPNTVSLLVREGDVAGDYLERLLDIVDYDGDIDLDVDNGRAMVAIVGGKELKPLVGPRGVTLDALQELTRLAVQQQTGSRSRLMLDIAGFRADRRKELGALARRTADEVAAAKEPRTLVPMNAFERKVVHDAVAAIGGVQSESEGEEPQRRVVVSPVS